MTIKIKTTEQYFPVVLFIMLYKVVLTYDSVDDPKCDHSHETIGKVTQVYRGAVYYDKIGGSNFLVCGQNSPV